MIDKNIAEQYWEYKRDKIDKVLTRDFKCIIQEVEAGVYKITLGIDSIMLDYFLINILEDKVIRCMRLDNQEYIDGTKEQLEKIKNIYNYKHYMTIIDKLNIPLYNNYNGIEIILNDKEKQNGV